VLDIDSVLVQTIHTRTLCGVLDPCRVWCFGNYLSQSYLSSSTTTQYRIERMSRVVCYPDYSV